jgi:hypothetical protein
MAVEVLIRLQEGNPGDGRHAGHIVMVKEIPHAGWGRMERPPKYGLITIPDKGMDAEIRQLLETPHRINLVHLTQATRDQIDMGRSPEMTWTWFHMKVM